MSCGTKGLQQKTRNQYTVIHYYIKKDKKTLFSVGFQIVKVLNFSIGIVIENYFRYAFLLTKQRIIFL